MNDRTAALIVAAGSSQRMKKVCKDKLLLEIKGIPVLARTLIQYQVADSIDDIYVVTRPELRETVATLATQYGIDKFRDCALGGRTRQHPVQNGLQLCKNASIVAIADGARPFTKPQHIDQTVAAAKQHGGAILCVPVKDTVKQLSPDGFIRHTPPRAQLLLAQTPQAFSLQAFTEYMERSIQDGHDVTDDASIFELYNQRVQPVIGDYDNIKITTEEDILQAETIAGKESV